MLLKIVVNQFKAFRIIRPMKMIIIFVGIVLNYVLRLEIIIVCNYFNYILLTIKRPHGLQTDYNYYIIIIII